MAALRVMAKVLQAVESLDNDDWDHAARPTIEADHNRRLELEKLRRGVGDMEGLRRRMTEENSQIHDLDRQIEHAISTIHQLHIDTRNAAIEEREEPGIFSDLIYGIGESASVDNSPSKRELDLLRHEIIPFRITDVECIQKIIDGFAYSGESVRYSVKAVSDAFKLLNRDEVPTRNQLRGLDARACKQMRRIIARPELYGTMTLSLD
ncbi:hypothetical protein FOXYSP1_11910 [Fusarium oxysporum f. sp. phaseoli]